LYLRREYFLKRFETHINYRVLVLFYLHTDLIELLDIIDQISDSGSVKAITNDRQSIKAGNKGVSFNNPANRIKKQYELLCF